MPSKRGNVPIKIIVLDGETMGMSSDAWDGLRSLGEVEVYDRSSAEEVMARARTAGVLITNKAPVSAEVIAQAPSSASSPCSPQASTRWTWRPPDAAAFPSPTCPSTGPIRSPN